MAKIRIEDIKKQIEVDGWSLISEEYKNLDSELTFKCNEGHTVLASWKQIRNKRTCPCCKDNKYKNQIIKVQAKRSGVSRTLALDQATHTCGWAIFDDNELVSYGTFSTNADDEIVRDSAIKQWLISMITNWKPDCVGLEGIQFQESEGAPHMSVTVFQALARLQGILMETCYDLKIKYIICPTNTWRHHCGVKGKSRADKKRSMQLLAKKWYDITISNDEADAIGIGRYAASLNSIKMIQWE